MTIEQACKKRILQFVDAVEIRNGSVTEKENEVAEKVAERLGLRSTAGSDAMTAHDIGALGTWVTALEKEIYAEWDLVKELHDGKFTIGFVR